MPNFSGRPKATKEILSAAKHEWTAWRNCICEGAAQVAANGQWDKRTRDGRHKWTRVCGNEPSCDEVASGHRIGCTSKRPGGWRLALSSLDSAEPSVIKSASNSIELWNASKCLDPNLTGRAVNKEGSAGFHSGYEYLDWSQYWRWWIAARVNKWLISINKSEDSPLPQLTCLYLDQIV